MKTRSSRANKFSINKEREKCFVRPAETPSTKKLNYCNNCGARLDNNISRTVQTSPPILPIAVGFFGIAGLFGFIKLLKILLDSRLDQPSILMILCAYLVTIFMICAVMIGQIWRRSGDTKKHSDNAPEDYAPPKTLRRTATNQLEEPREPFIGSVTDNTTRNFEKVPLKEI